MTRGGTRTFTTPRETDLGLRRIANAAGLSIGVLPNGCIFEIAHERGRIMINQVQGSPLAGGIARLYLCARDPEAFVAQAVGPAAQVRFGAARERFVWEGASNGLEHRAVLWLDQDQNVWLWRLDVRNARATGFPCDALLVQDIGLGGRGFLMNNEAYASQYIDHQIALHPRFGAVVMSRQNLAQGGDHPWVAHGCLDGAAAFATDALQLFGPAYRGWNRMIELLIENGAVVNTVSKAGVTPYLAASGFGDRLGGVLFNKEGADILLEHGADPKLGRPCQAQNRCRPE